MKRIGSQLGFTLPEVIVAGSIMIILCVGVLTAYTHVINLNRGNHIRAQALTVLQREVEEFRSFRFVPGTTDARLNAGQYPNYKVGVPSTSGGIPFNISVTVDNNPYDAAGSPLDAVSNADCRIKEITIEAVLQNPETGWLADLQTRVTIQRVRSN
ncbi:MAG TPA: type II secretion system protein [Pyrinomonadaceae bacterium]|nr:type II secretion system protein [Pyrinomonadaceae bacterium]